MDGTNAISPLDLHSPDVARMKTDQEALNYLLVYLLPIPHFSAHPPMAASPPTTIRSSFREIAPAHVLSDCTVTTAFPCSCALSFSITWPLPVRSQLSELSPSKPHFQSLHLIMPNSIDSPFLILPPAPTLLDSSFSTHADRADRW